jgi:hypothetical protein
MKPAVATAMAAFVPNSLHCLLSSNVVLPLNMFLYNVTIGIDQEVEQEWLQWIHQTHIPTVMATGMFATAKIYRVLHDADDGTVSYSLQFFSNTIDNVQQYLEKFAPAIVQEHRQRYQNRHVAFMTLLEEI